MVGEGCWRGRHVAVLVWEREVGVGGGEEVVVLLEGVEVVLLGGWLTRVMHRGIELRVLPMLLLCDLALFLFVGKMIAELG